MVPGPVGLIQASIVKSPVPKFNLGLCGTTTSGGRVWLNGNRNPPPTIPAVGAGVPVQVPFRPFARSADVGPEVSSSGHHATSPAGGTAHVRQPLVSRPANSTRKPVTVGLVSVSYTHLRAHETVLDLVCRLL